MAKRGFFEKENCCFEVELLSCDDIMRWSLTLYLIEKIGDLQMGSDPN